MKKLTWGIIFVCILSSASLAADPDAAGTAGTSGADGGASKGAEPVGWGGSSDRRTVVTVTAIILLTGVAMAAALSGSDSTTNH